MRRVIKFLLIELLHHDAEQLDCVSKTSSKTLEKVNRVPSGKTGNNAVIMATLKVLGFKDITCLLTQDETDYPSLCSL